MRLCWALKRFGALFSGNAGKEVALAHNFLLLLYPLPSREELSAPLTPEQYMLLQEIYEDFLEHRDLSLWLQLYRRFGLIRAGEEYARIMLDTAIQLAISRSLR